jgi:carbonic anhydrase
MRIFDMRPFCSRTFACTAVAMVMAMAAVCLRGITVTASEPPHLDAAGALARLKAGNDHFAHDAVEGQPIGVDRRTVLAKGQSPFAMVLSCADSRVPPEIIFNVGLGDIFVVRSAGEVADRSVVASLEYGAEHLHAPLLVVMGHEFCGAVKAASEAKPGVSNGPNLDFLLSAIQPAIARTAHDPEQERLKDAILANVDEVIKNTLQSSAILSHLVDEHQLRIAGAYYELASGRVQFLPEPAAPAPVGDSKTAVAGPMPRR